MVQGPPRPPDQPGQDGRDGWDGQIPQLPRGMINVPGVAPTPLDTTGLDNSFENLGRTMVDILANQQQTNLALQDQIRRANDTQIEQTLAMHDLVDMTEQRNIWFHVCSSTYISWKWGWRLWWMGWSVRSPLWNKLMKHPSWNDGEVKCCCPKDHQEYWPKFEMFSGTSRAKEVHLSVL